MNYLKFLKYTIVFLLAFLLGAQTIYAKTKLILPQNQISFSVEQNQSFLPKAFGIEKNVQPNVGFILEKYRFVVSERISAQNTYNFSTVNLEVLAQGVVNSADELADFVALHNISLPINKIEYIIQITGGQRNLCEGILLSTKEVVSGKNLNQLVQHFNIQVLPSPNTLSNYQTRIWYKWRKGEIPNLLDNTKTLEQQAEQAFNLRNQFRTNARTYMSDRPLANYLESVEQNMSWQQMKDKYPNLSGDALWNKIIEKSSSGREGIDDLFNLNDL